MYIFQCFLICYAPNTWQSNKVLICFNDDMMQKIRNGVVTGHRGFDTQVHLYDLTFMTWNLYLHDKWQSMHSMGRLEKRIFLQEYVQGCYIRMISHIWRSSSLCWKRNALSLCFEGIIMHFAAFHFWFSPIVKCTAHSVITYPLRMGHHCKGK